MTALATHAMRITLRRMIRPSSLHSLARPAIANRLTHALILPCALGSVALLGLGAYLALFASPADYQQGETVRIMYIHVPSAYLATLGYGLMALCGLFYLVWKHPVADMVARASAPVGASFALLTLATGSLWGKPAWGAWWVWDARLTSFFILFLLYLGYLALEGAFNHPERERKAASVLALIGAVNLPIIKFSVDWWSTLHQPASLLREGGSHIDPSMRAPLYVMLAGFTLFFAWMVLVRLDVMRIERRAGRGR